MRFHAARSGAGQRRWAAIAGLLSQGDSESMQQRALSSLQVAIELSGADEGLIMMDEADGEPVAHLGGEPSKELVQWVEQRLSAALTDDETILTTGTASLLDESETAFGSVRYRVAPLVKQSASGGTVIGMLALGFHHGDPQLPEHEALHAIGAHLGRGSA